MTLPERLCGRPAMAGGHLFVPCVNQGENQLSVYRVPLEGASDEPQPVLPFHWLPQHAPGQETAALCPLGSDAVLLVDQGRRLLRLEVRTKDLVRSIDQVGETFHLPEPMAGNPLLVGNQLLVFDAAGTLYRLDPANPNLEVAAAASTGIQPAAGPFLRDNRMIVIDPRQRLVCFSTGPASEGKPCWISADPNRGRIRGDPVLVREVLLVADNSRNVAGIRLRDGQTLWKEPLRVHVGPAAAAVPYGRDKVLVPLADGTLLVLSPKPSKPTEARP